MKFAFRALALSAVALPLLVTAARADDTLKTDEQKFSYIIGLDIGNQIKKVPVEIDLNALTLAIGHAVKGEKSLLTDQEVNDIRSSFMAKMQSKAQEMQAKAEAETKAAGDKNKTEGEAFLAENQKKEGITTTASGLQYQVVKKGDGPLPKATDTVTVNYRGTLLNGTEFDSSYKRNEPATFQLDGVIPGWTEGLQLMPVGSTYKFFIPAKLAYGERGAGQAIGPNSTLVFEVELLGIK